MAEVIRLHDEVEPTENQAEMIDLLETIINEIRSGRTVSFAIATVTVDRGCTTRWMMRDHELDQTGAVARLLWDMSKGPMPCP